jgi:hypothetical protein
MRFRFAVLLAVLALPAAVLAQAVTFDFTVEGKPAGKDTYTLAKDKHGYKLHSKYHFNVHSQDGDYSNDYKFNDVYATLEVAMSINSDQPVLVSYIPNKARNEVTISRVTGGSQNNDFFTIKPDFFILPPFDAGAAQAFLLACSLPATPSTVNIYVPTFADTRSHGTPADARFVKGTTVNGTLDGKPITAKTFLLFTPDFRWIFYADDTNNLLQLDEPIAKASFVRQHFTLADPPVTVGSFGKETH